ncbi:MAG: uroporphyrinogen-III synthase [Pseudomonadota bacterium]
MADEWRVVVTRPERQAGRLVSDLSTCGFKTLTLPLLKIEPIRPLAPADRQCVIDLDQFAHVVFVSANAVEEGLDVISDYWPQYPIGPSFWAVGEATAQSLMRHGIEAQRPDSDMSSEGLLKMPGLNQVASEKILIVKGEGGRGLLADELTRRGATVHLLHCYRRAPEIHDAQHWIRVLEEPKPTLILVSSGEGLGLLTRLLQPEEHTNLAKHTVVAPSQRVAYQAQTLGWQSVQLADNAADATMVIAAEGWRSSYPRGTNH